MKLALLKDDFVVLGTEDDIKNFAKIADEIGGIVVEITGPKVTDFNIIYCAGENKALQAAK